jgi:hypothetical protein
MTADALFSDEGLRVEVTHDEATAGERMRRRQALRIAHGCHPLSIYGVCIPLHADAPRDAYRGDPRPYPRCGDCQLRQMVGGHAKAFPKCLYGYQAPLVSTAPRYSQSEASDVRAWWPACIDYQPEASS